MTNLISGDKFKFSTVLQEDISGSLLRVDTNTTGSNDSTGSGVNLEFFSDELDARSKRSFFRDTDSSVGKVGVRSQDNFESDFIGGGHFSWMSRNYFACKLYFYYFEKHRNISSKKDLEKKIDLD